MVSSTNWIRRHIANGLVLLLIAPLAQAAPAARPQAQSGASSQTAQPSENPNSGQPQTAPAQEQPAPAQQAGSAQQQSAPQQTNTAQPPNAPEPRQTEPVGTAAAPYENPVGAAVSRPAGAAIAPAKQKRRRSFLIRMGLVIGAAVAVGTVVALSKASPSRPSH